mmetsp:Transcript_21910/g.45640  ORF Transcript_21910/g.45640 Transcript_21910/m.45640 type:complete len:116 (+) Transcript_21910:1514-1861(+)
MYGRSYDFFAIIKEMGLGEEATRFMPSMNWLAWLPTRITGPCVGSTDLFKTSMRRKNTRKMNLKMDLIKRYFQGADGVLSSVKLLPEAVEISDERGFSPECGITTPSKFDDMNEI